MVTTMMTGRTNSLMQLLLLLFCTRDMLNHSFVHGFPAFKFPQQSTSSSATGSTTTTLFSSTDHYSSSSKNTSKKRKTRFHYYKKTTPAFSQKQKSLERGNHPLVSLNLNLDSLAKSGAANRAQELLHRIEALHEEGYYDVAPDAVSYNSVLNAWARSTDESSADRAVDLLQSMRETETVVTPNLVTYNTLILAFAKRGLAQNAEAVLRAMQESSIQPDIISFNSVLYAWAFLKEGEKAESLLKEMISLTVQGNNTDVKPDTISFNTVLHAYRYNPRRASLILKHMETLHEAGNDDVEPDVYSYTCCIQAWASSTEKAASFQAKQLLETMETLSKKRKELTPNIVSYTCVMTALSKSNQRGAAQEAQCILERMLERYRAGDVRVKPDTVAFTTVIDAWARDCDSPKNAAQHALDLLEQLKSLQNELGVTPNALTYTSVIRALKNSRDKNSATIAESLLGEIVPQPSTIHYNAVIDAHAKSPNWNKAERALELMQVMEARNVTTDIITHNSVLAACANSFGGSKGRALEIATKVYSRIEGEATPITYFLLFKAFRKLVPSGDTRWSMIQRAFQKCSQSGLASERVLEQVRLGCTSDEYKKLVSGAKHKTHCKI
jgi:pentatricopeptide repeat protein